MPEQNNLPIFYHFIWLELIYKYLRPIEVVKLSWTCRALRELIRDSINRYWHFICQLENREITCWVHNDDIKVNCLSFSVCRENNIPVDYQESNSKSSVNKEDYFKIHETPVIKLFPQIAIKEKLLNQSVYKDHIQHWKGHLAVERYPSVCCRIHCVKRKHWIEIHDLDKLSPYPMFNHQIFTPINQEINYYFQFINLYYNKYKTIVWKKFRRIKHQLNELNKLINNDHLGFDESLFHQRDQLKKKLLDEHQSLPLNFQLEFPVDDLSTGYQVFKLECQQREEFPLSDQEISDRWGKLTEDQRISYRSKANFLSQDNSQKLIEFQQSAF